MVGLLVFAVAACGGEHDDDSSGSQRTESTTTTTDEATTTTVDEEAAVLEAYQSGWSAFEEASDNPANPGHPGLAETMTGAALQAVATSLGELAETGDYFSGPPVEHTASVRNLFPDRAVVDDCAMDPGVRYAADGSVVDSADPTPYSYEAVMVKEDGRWKRSELNLGDPCEL